MITYTYSALRITQTTTDKPIILFSALVTEIDRWAGVPQKKKFGEGIQTQESVGFQRDENSKRIESLKSFFADQNNIIQNPLLCAARTTDSHSISFEPADGQDANSRETFGTLLIHADTYKELSFEDVLSRVRKYLEDRVPELANRKPSDSLIASLKELARNTGHLEQEYGDQEDQDPPQEQSDGNGGEMTAVLFEESHILDFWEEIAARHEIAKLIASPISGNSFLGFSKEALSSYLCPVVLVDGQHRLRGAVEAAIAKTGTPEVQTEIEARVSNGEAPEHVEAILLAAHARSLPVSLLLTSDPSEQVFQFVCVNQKATPIGKALLGTIVSTTLSNNELERVAGRLRAAGIDLAESQAISYLAKHPDSPFVGLVERGLANDAKDLLQWGVFASLIEIFRDLRGGKLYHQNVDFADAWRHKYLNHSKIASSYADKGFASPFAYWGDLNGPWRDVFITFWSAVRDYFGNTTDSDKPNYWGCPRLSNLFNKVSLTILASDFFEYIHVQKQPLEDIADLKLAISEWLENVDRGYFDKDWNLAGIKKDNPGIRKRWASIWNEYRKNPVRLPDRRNYRNAMAD